MRHYHLFANPETPTPAPSAGTFGRWGGFDEMITQLNPPLPMETSKGGGWAHFVIDYGPEAALLWVVFMDIDGACWTVPNSEVRMTFNWTMGQRKPELTNEREKTVELAPQPLRSAFPRAAGDQP